MMAMIWLRGGNYTAEKEVKPLRGGKGDPEVKWRGQGSRNTALTREQVEELSRYSSRLADAADFPGGHSCLITAIFSIQPGKAQPLGWNGSEGKRQRMGLGKRSEPVTESPTVNQMSFVFSTACSTELVNTVTVRQHTNSGHHLCSMNFPSPLCHLFFFFSQSRYGEYVYPRRSGSFHQR